MPDKEVDDLLLNLMQIADETPVEDPPNPNAPQNPLTKLKPYVHHRECGGMVGVRPLDDSDVNGFTTKKEDLSKSLMVFCVKCEKEELVPIKIVEEHSDGATAAFKMPDWVADPDV